MARSLYIVNPESEVPSQVGVGRARFGPPSAPSIADLSTAAARAMNFVPPATRASAPEAPAG